MTTPLAPRTRPVGPVVGAVLGVPIVAYGIWGLLNDSDLTHPVSFAVWFVGADVVADLVLLPLLVGGSYLLTRPLPAWTQPTVRFGIAVSAVLTLVAWPEIGGYGENPDIPSLLPRDELAGLFAYLGVVWLTVVAVLGYRLVRSPSVAARKCGTTTGATNERRRLTRAPVRGGDEGG